MKKLFLLTALTIVFSCVTESRMYQRVYLLKNDYTKDIALKFYLTSNKQLSNEIFINNKEVLNGEPISFDQPHSTDPNYGVLREFGKGGDSLVITYNNERKSVLYIDFNGNFSTPIERNPFRFGNYENLGNDDFQFTIMEEDYNNAEDCNGNCD
jgi:hypothetical protein